MQQGLYRLGFYLVSLASLAGCQLTPTETETVEKATEKTVVTEEVQPTTVPVQPTISVEELARKKEMLRQQKIAKNLWFDLQQQFSWNHSVNATIKKELKRLLRHHAPLKAMNKNAAPHLHHIVNELKKRNMPAELALLPLVESNFDPFAYSHGGAAGLWQFMPATARRYGLTSDWWFEGRRDTLQSTQAALSYLQYLAKYFNGDWLLAVAAYNAGEGRVKQAIRRNKKRKKPTDFWSLSLPLETRVYVPRLLAVVELVTHPGKYGLKLPQLKNQTLLAPVETGGQIEIAIAAELADMPIADFHRINAGFNRWATPPNKNYPLLVPADKKALFEQKLAALPKEQRITWHRYKVRKGDSLSTIAQSFGTQAKALRTVNKLKGDLIRIGQPLMIPNGNYSGKTPFRLAKTKIPAHTKNKLTYKVRKNDNLWTIAKKFSVQNKDIARWNGLRGNAIIRPGQKLTIYANQMVNGKATQYQVKNGDSLYLIAKRFKVTVKKLTDWNNLSLNNYLQPGQMLKIYL